MKRIEARIKTPFGEVIVEGENPQEILDMLGLIPENFVKKLSDFVSDRLTPSGAQLKGIIEATTEGPVIVTRENLTHYEAVGLVMYASTEQKEHGGADPEAFGVQRNKKYGTRTAQRND